MNEFCSIAPDVKLGKGVRLSKFINLYGCEVGDETKIGAFVEIQKNAKVGRRCKISSHTFVCEGVAIEDNVFISSHVVISGEVTIGANSFLGVNATISNYVHVGARCYIGANALIVHNTPPDSVYVAKSTSMLEQIDSLRFLQVIRL